MSVADPRPSALADHPALQNIDAETADYAATAKVRAAEAEARDLVNYQHRLALSEVEDLDPFAECTTDYYRLPEGHSRRKYHEAVARVDTAASCPTDAEMVDLTPKAKNRRVLAFIKDHKPGTRRIREGYFYDAEGKRVSR